MRIDFYPEWDDRALVKAADEYQDIWDADGARIVEAMRSLSGLKFVERRLYVLVYEGPSHSSPMMLRASYDTETKKAALVHELCHRLMLGNTLRDLKLKETAALIDHKVIDLILYDIWIDLWGKEVADRQVRLEAKRQHLFKEAWQWALVLSRAERRAAFDSLKSK